MDKITFNCPLCMHPVAIPIEFAGKKGKCPKCREVVEIPQPTQKRSASAPHAAKRPGLIAPGGHASKPPGFIAPKPGLRRPGGIAPQDNNYAQQGEGYAGYTPPGQEQGTPVYRSTKSRYSLRSHSFGDTVGTIFKMIFSDRFPQFFLIMFLAQLPMLVVKLLVSDSQGNQFLTVLAVFAGFALTYVGTGAVVKSVACNYLGEKADLGDCFSTGFSKVLSILWFIVICFFIAIGLTFALSLLTFILAMAGPLGAIVAMGAAIFVVLRLFLTLSVAIPAIVVEDIGGLAGFKRSMQLTEGSLMHIFGIFFVLILPFLVIGLILGLTNSANPSAMQNSSVGLVIINFLIGLCGSIASSVAMVVIYFDLRAGRESFGLEQLAKVFD